MKKFWEFRNAANGGAELLLYGEISQESWNKDATAQKDFARELKSMGEAREIVVRINSGGGDVFAAQAIGNMLECSEARVTARIEGLCASAATIVACHCDRVTAARDATYMVHPVRVGLAGYYSAKELEDCLMAAETIRESILDLYERKTGREAEEIAAWMDGTNWWTARQAMEYGFVDELLDTNPVTVENRAGALFINGVNMDRAFDSAPEFLRARLTQHDAPQARERKQRTMDEQNAKGKIGNMDELREAYPELVDTVERTAAHKERERIQRIADMAVPGCEDLTRAAMYEKPVTPECYAVAALARMRQEGARHLEESARSAAPLNNVGQEARTQREDEFLNALRSVTH